MDIYAYVHMTVLAYAGAAVQKGEGAVDDREFAKILTKKQIFEKSSVNILKIQLKSMSLT